MHVPVLVEQTLNVLAPQRDESYLDLTAGFGGHADAVLKVTKSYDQAILVDQDETAISFLKKKYEGKDVRYMRTNFANACQELQRQNLQFDMILADIGVSSQHLDNASRGFSFMADGPLDMRMDREQPLTAALLVNNSSREELLHILREYGEEKHAHRIVEEIIQHRPLTTTYELASCIERAIGWRQKGHHPATRTFQAIRIAVNDELNVLQQMLPVALQLLRPGGRFGVISFHSLEDRIVKRIFSEVTSGGYEAEYSLLTKKPMTASSEEIVFNPRARSAKLRAVAKIKKERTE